MPTTETKAHVPAVLLLRPQEEGNIGGAARAMANMGLDKLILIDPETPIGSTARAFAVGADRILDRARIYDTLPEALEPFRRVVGTTSARSRELAVQVLAPRELPERLQADAPGTPTALLFGGEASGLTNDELALCSPLVRVPCSTRQPTLNLSQAVLLVAYELYLARDSSPDPGPASEPPATGAELEGLFAQLTPLLTEIGFARDDTFDSVLSDLKQLAARSGPTSREVQILRGICRRGQRAFGRSAKER